MYMYMQTIIRFRAMTHFR